MIYMIIKYKKYINIKKESYIYNIIYFTLLNAFELNKL